MISLREIESTLTPTIATRVLPFQRTRNKQTHRCPTRYGTTSAVSHACTSSLCLYQVREETLALDCLLSITYCLLLHHSSNYRFHLVAQRPIHIGTHL